MSKEITKSIILQEMQDKLKLREFAPSNFLFDETVVPVYNIEQHLEDFWNKYITSTTITGIGGIGFATVPSTEKWTLYRYDLVFMSGVITVAGVYVTRVNRTPIGAYIYLDLTAAQTVSYHVDVNPPIVLQPGDVVSASVDGYTSDAILRLYIDYKRETIR